MAGKTSKKSAKVAKKAAAKRGVAKPTLLTGGTPASFATPKHGRALPNYQSPHWSRTEKHMLRCEYGFHAAPLAKKPIPSPCW
jgi:hypothetical protein